MGGLFILLVGVFALLMLLDKLPSTAQKGLFIAFIPMALAAAYFGYMSIDEPIKFNIEKKKRYTRVIERVKTIRDWQLAYKSVHKVYAPNFDSLFQFSHAGEVLVQLLTIGLAQRLLQSLGVVGDEIQAQRVVHTSFPSSLASPARWAR